MFCAVLYFMPTMKEGFVAAVETVPEVLLQETSIQIEENLVQKDKLNIELPENMQGKDVEITNDYVNHTVYIMFYAVNQIVYIITRHQRTPSSYRFFKLGKK